MHRNILNNQKVRMVPIQMYDGQIIKNEASNSSIDVNTKIPVKIKTKMHLQNPKGKKNLPNVKEIIIQETEEEILEEKTTRTFGVNCSRHEQNKLPVNISSFESDQQILQRDSNEIGFIKKSFTDLPMDFWLVWSV